MMMAGFGALALFQGLQVYRMQRQLQKQNDVILESARSGRNDTDSDVQTGQVTPPKLSGLAATNNAQSSQQ